MLASSIGMMRILFRVDASLHIGSGHVMRCRTLARELQRRGAELVFICRRQAGDLIEILQQEFHVLVLCDQSLLSTYDLNGRQLYRAWLGCTQQKDAAECIEALDSEQIFDFDWLVIDHYGIDVCWESIISKQTKTAEINQNTFYRA